MKLSFADCLIDLRARQLWRGQQVVPLEPKMFQLLEILVERRPAVVANEELDELLWPKVYVARTSLARLVSALRSAVGDEPRDSRIIRTVYKTGYAFCAAVSIAPDEAAQRRTGAVYLVWKERFIPLCNGEHIAGRGAECSVLIDATTVSRRHAKFVVKGTFTTIEDLNSTNGTQVDGIPISVATPLINDSKVTLGSEHLLVRIRNPSAATVRVSRTRSHSADGAIIK